MDLLRRGGLGSDLTRGSTPLGRAMTGDSDLLSLAQGSDGGIELLLSLGLISNFASQVVRGGFGFVEQ